MALSQKKTTLSVLRGILGPYFGREAVFSKLVSKSVSWVKKTSAGIKPLSEETARLISHETGINPDWLQGCDTSKPPTDLRGKPYSLKIFENRRAELESGEYTTFTVFNTKHVIPQIAAIGSAAGKQGKVSLFAWKWEKFIKECRETFGFDDEAFSAVLKEGRFFLLTFSDAFRNCKEERVMNENTFSVRRPEFDKTGCKNQAGAKENLDKPFHKTKRSTTIRSKDAPCKPLARKARR
jgi:hypothetical protein